jgi:ribosomal protein S18 acetylase RimI-like enzyme
MQVRPAVKADLPAVGALLAECARWLNAKGIDQWRYQSLAEAVALAEKRFCEGELYVAILGEELAGCVTLQARDGFWGALGRDPESYYLHSIAIARRHKGEGLGKELMRWAEEQVRALGKQWLCLDHFSANEHLARYYADLGYRRVGSRDWEGRVLSFLAKEL